MADTNTNNNITFNQNIQWEEEPARPDRSSEDQQAPSRAAAFNDEDGIRFIRSRSQSLSHSLHRRRSISRRPSLKRTSTASSDEEGLRHPGDIKTKQLFHGTQLLFLAYQSIGVIYGDIGTSPLYVFSGTFTSTPSRDDVIGVLSLIVYSLLLMVTLKYVLIILHADNEGEGGTFSCYSLLSRFANITHRDPRELATVRMQRYGTNELRPANRRLRDVLEGSAVFKGVLKAMGVFAVSMVMSDGVLTPAQSVLGAVQGINVIQPDISNGTVVGATCGILVLLFVIQPFGTTKIGVVFAPVIIVWLALLASFGIYNISKYDAGVFKAFNPGEAFDYLIRHGEEGWRSLGGVLLAFTGVEALFADLGAFSMSAIQISWLCFCLPCLLLTYIGQAAYLAVKPEAYAYPVFNTVPPGWLIPTMIFAILAAVVASQAIITATFQLLAQIVKLSYFPQIEVKHTSKTFHNQLYVPLVNYLLCIGTVVITAVFRNTTSLGQAYGVCVMFVTFFDTQMTFLTAILVWRFQPWMVVLPWLAFSAMDGAFLSSALTKVPDGAWFTLTLASVLAAVFILWRFGKEQQWSAERKDRKPLSFYVKRGEDAADLRLASPTDESLSITKGFGIFFDKTGEMTPIVFSQFLNKLVSVPEVTILFHLRPLESPTVPEEERYVVRKLEGLPHCYRVLARFGYMDEVVTHDLAGLIHREVRKAILHTHSQRRTSLVAAPSGIDEETPHASGIQLRNLNADSSDSKSAISSKPVTDIVVQENEDESPGAVLALLQRAFDHRVLYVIGKEEMHIAPKTNWMRLVLLKIFLFVRENTRKKMDNVKVPADRLVEIGFMMEV